MQSPVYSDTDTGTCTAGGIRIRISLEQTSADEDLKRPLKSIVMEEHGHTSTRAILRTRSDNETEPGTYHRQKAQQVSGATSYILLAVFRVVYGGIFISVFLVPKIPNYLTQQFLIHPCIQVRLRSLDNRGRSLLVIQNGTMHTIQVIWINYLGHEVGQKKNIMTLDVVAVGC